MTRVSLKVTQRSDLLSANLKKLSCDTKSKDFRVICKGKLFLMHKFLLRIFADDPLGPKNEEMELRNDDYEPHIFQHLLDIMYSGETVVEHSDIKSLQLCAQLMGMSNLIPESKISALEEHLSKIINPNIVRPKHQPSILRKPASTAKGSKRKSKEQLIKPPDQCHFSTVWLPDIQTGSDLKLSFIDPYQMNTKLKRDSYLLPRTFEKPPKDPAKPFDKNMGEPVKNSSFACYLCTSAFLSKDELIRHCRLYHLD